MKKKIDILCTLGPSSLNKNFLKKIKNKVSLVRLNMSHLSLIKLEQNIKFIKKNSNIPICIDTEGAQIRTKIRKMRAFKTDQVGIIGRGLNFSLYPDYILKKIKKGHILDVGFDNLKIKIISVKSDKLLFRTLSPGRLENNKGVHLINGKINLDYLTKKDLTAIKLARKYKIKNFALSFANSSSDIKKFNKLLPRENKIFKIETLAAIKNLNSMIRLGKNFLIDRGDLSKEIGISKIPQAQRYIINKINKKKGKKVLIATNYLESMIINSYPTRGEANDIFSAIEMGAGGLVLAAETAVGSYPVECVIFLEKMINESFKKFNIK